MSVITLLPLILGLVTTAAWQVEGWTNVLLVGRWKPSKRIVSMNVKNQDFTNDLEKDLYNQLPPLGDSSDLLLDGENFLQERRKNQKLALKPTARVRLFCLYGVADASISLRTWITNAPDWAEVRILELPGHGYLGDTTELPPCAYQQPKHPVPRGELQNQFNDLIQELVNQIEPLVVAVENDNQRSNYAIYGFSFGALIGYEICQELDRRGLPPPIAMFAVGRGAPHAIIHSESLENELQLCADEDIIDFMKCTMGLNLTVPQHHIPRTAARFRCGMLLSGMYAGTNNDGVANTTLWDDVYMPINHAANVPCLKSPVVSITASLDTIWPPHLVQKWCDTTTTTTTTTTTLQPNYEHVCLEELTHEQLMNAPDTKQVVWNKLLDLALQQATRP